MNLTGLHILLTYQCTQECDHCFVWGSPWQSGVFTVERLDQVFQQAQQVSTINEIYFEGGEPFLYYPLLLHGVRAAASLGYTTGIVSNAYWATALEDACAWLKPLQEAGLQRLEVSSDLFHGSAAITHEAQTAARAAERLGISTALIQINPPSGYREPGAHKPGAPVDGGGVMYRGRAAAFLTKDLPGAAWDSFKTCPYEDLLKPQRLHVDPDGYLHLCQGLVVGNLFERPLVDIWQTFNPHMYPVVAALVKGGPAELARKYNVPHQDNYVDACHLCYSVRFALRKRFPDILVPEQMYGVMN